MSTLFVIGAGASYGSGTVEPYPPPLGAGLFEELLRFSSSARNLPEIVKNKFQGPDFEKGMDFLFKEYCQLSAEFLSQMSSYFLNFRMGQPHIDYKVPSYEYIFKDPIRAEDFPVIVKNHYQTLLEIIVASEERTILSTTNYELLLEDAIESVGKDVSYNFEDSNRHITLLKPHGSCNFLPKLENFVVHNIGFKLREGQQIAGKNNAMFLIDEYIAASRNEASKFCREQNSIPPVISMYMPSKEAITGRELIQDQYKKWVAATSEATDIFVIGMRVYRKSPRRYNWSDSHIWGRLAKTNANIHYIGGEPDTFKEWAFEHKKHNVNILASTFEEGLSPIRDYFGPKNSKYDMYSSRDYNFRPRHGNHMKRYGEFKT